MLIDNRTHGNLARVLADGIRDRADLSVLTADFSLYGYEALRETFQRAASLRLLFPRDQPSGDDFWLEQIAGGESDRALRNRLTAAAIAKACAHWFESRAAVRAMSRPAGHNLYHVANPDGGAWLFTAVRRSRPAGLAGCRDRATT